jgi:hypothetical protein
MNILKTILKLAVRIDEMEQARATRCEQQQQQHPSQFHNPSPPLHPEDQGVQQVGDISSNYTGGRRPSPFFRERATITRKANLGAQSFELSSEQCFGCPATTGANAWKKR